MAHIKGGDLLAKKLQDIASLISNASSVRVGFLAESTYPSGQYVATIAAIQEYGAASRGIPPRPFFRNMIAKRKGEWPDAVKELLKDNGYDALRTLQLTGEAIASQLRQSIVDTNSPPLKPATIKRKGGTSGMVYNPADLSTFAAKPLVHTGHMLNSINYQVKE
jgi:hypothetical protein